MQCNGYSVCFGDNLSFYAWYKWGQPFPVIDTTSISAVKKSIAILLTSIKEFTPCNHGNGWKLQKFHKLLHLPVDIYMFGSPQNYDNSPTEHGLIETAKWPSDHAQKSNALFVSQVTKCVLDTVLIKKVKQALLCSRTEESEESHLYEFSKLSNSASFHITFDDDGKCLPKWLGKPHLKNDVQLESVLLHWLYLSKKNKTSIFMKFLSFLCIWNIQGMGKYSDVIQTIAQMANGMIGLWFDLKIPKIIAKGCGHQTIIHAKLCVFYNTRQTVSLCCGSFHQNKQ